MTRLSFFEMRREKNHLFSWLAICGIIAQAERPPRFSIIELFHVTGGEGD